MSKLSFSNPASPTSSQKSLPSHGSGHHEGRQHHRQDSSASSQVEFPLVGGGDRLEIVYLFHYCKHYQTQFKLLDKSNTIKGLISVMVRLLPNEIAPVLNISIDLDLS